jgi:hypothetical protein
MEPQKICARNMNKHNIYVKTGLASETQLISAVNAFHKQLCEMFPEEHYEDCEFIVNLVTDKDGNTYKYAYLWVSDTRIYYIMTGLNPDGSERYKDEEEQKSKEKIEESFELDFDEMNWETITSNSIQNVVTIREPLGPILSLPGYEYTSEQLVKVKETLKEKYGTEYEESKIPSVGYFEASRAQAGGSIEDGRCPHILRSIVPNWITKELIKKNFERYSTDEYDSKLKSKPYPRVTLEPFIKKDYTTGRVSEDPTKKVALVEFNKSKNDGIFARQIARKVYFVNPTNKTKDITIWDYLKVFERPDNSGSSHGGSKPPYNGGSNGGGRSNFGFKSKGGGDGSSFFDRAKK